jgi:phosphate-selective porin OprO and OprP
MRNGFSVCETRLRRRKIGWPLAIAVLAGCGLFQSTAQAQDINSPAIDDLKRMVDQQQQQIRQMHEEMVRLQQAMPAQSSGAVVPAVPVSADVLPAADGAKKPGADGPAKPDDKSYVVGSDLNVKTNFRDGYFLWFATPNNDFTMHIGFWAQWDNVWFDQSPSLKAAPIARTAANTPGFAGGVAGGGIGDLQDGTFFRRVRPFFEGTFWENGEYKLILALENDQFQTAGLDEFWFGAKDIPILGSVRVGHVKTPMGLEGDMTSSSRCMTFMERSIYSEAIELNQNFVTGLWLGDTYLDQRVTWQGAVFRPDINSSTGAYFGDSQGGIQGRLTALPYYENEGRDLVHVAVSGGFRTNDNTSFRRFQLRARQQLRDDDPAGGVTNADNNRLIDTGVITGTGQALLGTEFLWIRGPLSFQAEYGWDYVNGAIAGTNPIAPAQNLVFSGGYMQVAYTLTGENRSYDRRLGTLAREYYGKSGPYSNANVIRDDEGYLHCGTGAWEVAARYDYVNLNDGTGTGRIVGGIANGVTLGLNCYLNNNFNIMFDWVYDQRDDVPRNSAQGWVSGIGTEVQFQF